jgi:hypothetical protein
MNHIFNIQHIFFRQVLDVNEQNGLHAHISNFVYSLTYNGLPNTPEDYRGVLSLVIIKKIYTFHLNL